jgi:hypothetical protein
MQKGDQNLNPGDRLYFSKHALDSNPNAYLDEPDRFEFEDDFCQSHFINENNIGEFDDDLWEK